MSEPSKYADTLNALNAMQDSPAYALRRQVLANAERAIVHEEHQANAVRALLIEMRQYVMHHGVLIGECVAWNKLKKIHGVGLDEAADLAWLEEHRAKRGLT